MSRRIEQRDAIPLHEQPLPIASRVADSQRPRPIAVRLLRARVSLAIAILLLTGTALYLVAHLREQIWSAGRLNGLNIAVGLEKGVSGLLEQTSTDFAALSPDVAATPALSQAQLFALLQGAIRFDALSRYLGVIRASGELTAITREGSAPNPAVGRALESLPRSRGAATEIGYLVRLPDGAGYYMPLTFGVPHPGGEVDTLFALVPVERLTAATKSLELIKGGWVNFATTDGKRLFRYIPIANRLETRTGRMAPEVLEVLAQRPFGVVSLSHFSASTRRTASPDSYMDAYSRSTVVPLYVAATIPASSLYGAWLDQSIAPLIVLVLGVAAVAGFGVQLRAALREQRSYLEEQEYLARHDTLTGLLNRNAFMRLLQSASEAPEQAPFTVVILDLTRFKDVNDTLGYASGDQVLAEVSRRLLAALADEAQLARLGGDELAVFATRSADTEAAAALCTRLQRVLRHPIHVSGVELELTASMGVVIFPEDAKTPSEVLRCASVARASSKSELKPHARYVHEMDDFTPEMLALKSDFARALREGGLTLAYQPKVNLHSGALAGFEALARWTHATLGPIPPARFVQLAENTELIHTFTQRVLRIAIEQIAIWRSVGQQVQVSVNISVNNLLDQTFVEKVAQLLAAANVPAELLELEVTESAVLRHPDTTLKRLHEIRSLGVRLAIDDFGTGYASLAYLKQLPVQTLKVDKGFVLQLASDVADQRIVRSAIQLAHGFGMQVCAEGVETQAAAVLLREYGCDHAQGYYFSHPVAAHEIEPRYFEATRPMLRLVLPEQRVG